MIEAESKTVLKELAEHDFTMHLKNGRSTGNGTARMGFTSRMMVANRHKVSF
jgi:hypothetical protein